MKSNNLIYKTQKTVGKETIYVSICLNDECKNGHQDFAITGDIYKAGNPKEDKYHIAGGCIHDEIAKHFPKFAPFIALHLCDAKGVPMHAAANGFYFLQSGFSNTPTNSPDFESEYCKYYRITPKQFSSLKQCKNQLQFALSLDKLGVLAQWESEANEAIKFLEELTGNTFVNDSVKSQYHTPTPEAIAEEEEKQKSGYYTPEAEAQRAAADFQKLKDKLTAEMVKEIAKAEREYLVKFEVLAKGGKRFLDNIIFYNHSDTLAFNWRGYDSINQDEINALIPLLNLPEGVKVENKGK